MQEVQEHRVHHMPWVQGEQPAAEQLKFSGPSEMGLPVACGRVKFLSVVRATIRLGSPVMCHVVAGYWPQ